MQGSHSIPLVLKGYILSYSRCESGNSATSKMKQFVTIVEAFIISKIKTLYFQYSVSLDLHGLGFCMGFFNWTWNLQHIFLSGTYIVFVCMCVCMCVCVGLNFITRQFSFRFCIILSYNCSLVFLTKKNTGIVLKLWFFFLNPNKDVYVSWIHNNILRFTLFWHLNILRNIGLIIQWTGNIT